MAYNLYQVQLAKAWSQRIDKENAQAEQFWTKQAERPLLSYTARHLPGERSVAGSSKASSSAAPTGYTSKTSYLKTRLDALEADLMKEREHRKRVEDDLEMIRTGSLSSTYSSGGQPATPRAGSQAK